MRTDNTPYFDILCDFQTLLKAHKVARLGKQGTKDEITFDAELSQLLWDISDALRNGTYRIKGYYRFEINDPKKREIHALYYIDRIVQHALCDNVLAPIIEPRLIYDNAACRIGKGTHFALARQTKFLCEYRRKFGEKGYILRCDIKKFFDNIDHAVLKAMLRPIISDDRIYAFLEHIIDSYHTTPGKGLPLGNQTSQWFAIYYLNRFDRLIKEKFGIKYYTRYMDDAVLIHPDKQYLEQVKAELEQYLASIGLTFNPKTQIFPIKNGVEYLGFRFSLNPTGKVIRRVKRATKKRMQKRLKKLEKQLKAGEITEKDIQAVKKSYEAHLKHGTAKGLIKKL